MRRAARVRHAADWRDGCLVIVVLMMFLPVALDRDSLPLSTYPMYSRSRPEAVALVTANGVRETGERERLGLEAIGDSADPLIVAGELRAAVRAGEAQTACERIAARVARTGADLSSVEVVTERHDVVRRTVGEASLLGREQHATCPVAEATDG